ncbi:MAG: hypothetical protein AAFN93_00540 [Bacteroidota bacterium]
MKVLNVTFILLMSLMSSHLIAQPGNGQRPSIEERVEREKSRVLKKVTDLTEDQQLIFDQVYVEYGQALKDAFEANGGDLQSMRESMLKIRSDKDEALKEILNENQYVLYEGVMNQQRQNRQRRRNNRNGSGSNG